MSSMLLSMFLISGLIQTLWNQFHSCRISLFKFDENHHWVFDKSSLEQSWIPSRSTHKQYNENSKLTFTLSEGRSSRTRLRLKESPSHHRKYNHNHYSLQLLLKKYLIRLTIRSTSFSHVGPLTPTILS